MIRIIACIVLLLGVANAAVDQKQRLRVITSKIHGLKKNLQQEKKQRQKLQADLRHVEVSIGKLSKRLRQLVADIGEKNQQLQQLQGQQQQYKKQVMEQRAMLAKQVNFAYRLGKYEYLQLLLNQQKSGLVDRSLTYFSYFNQARLTIVHRLQATVHSLQVTENKIRQHQQKLKGLRQREQAEQTRLKKYHADRQQLVVKLTKSIKKKDHRLLSLLTSKRALEAVIRKIPTQSLTTANRQPFARRKGKLPWPLQGKIIRHFGSAVAQNRLSYNGVLIKAQPGQAVRAVSGGKIVFADWLSGFGLLMIVQHNGQYMTLYGHNQSLYKRTGDWVNEGDLLATVGKSGGYYQSGLYFEIRHRAKPLNPERWCQKKGVFHYAGH